MRDISLDNFVGQTNTVNTLKVISRSAKMRNVAMPHIMFYGASGCGKTQLAMSLSKHYGCSIQIVNAAAIKNINDLSKFIFNLNEDDILFIDEIHRLSKKTQEALFHVLEDFRLDITVKNNVESYQLDPFTCIAATTDLGLLLKPLRDRFKHNLELELYNNDEMMEIIKFYVAQNRLSITKGGANIIINTSRGTPRLCKSHVEWVRDYCLVHNIKVADSDVVSKALMAQGYDENGMSKMDRRYLSFLSKMNGPVGVDTISSGINLDIETISNVIEPWLIQNNIVFKTPKGRVINNNNRVN